MLRPNIPPNPSTEARLTRMRMILSRGGPQCEAHWHRLCGLYGRSWSQANTHPSPQAAAVAPQVRMERFLLRQARRGHGLALARAYAPYQGPGGNPSTTPVSQLAYQRDNLIHALNMQIADAIRAARQKPQSAGAGAYLEKLCAQDLHWRTFRGMTLAARAQGFVSARSWVRGMVSYCAECNVWSPVFLHMCPHLEWDSDEDEDEDEPADRRCSYHRHPLRHQGYFDENAPAHDPAFGMEIELYCEDVAELEWVCEGYILEEDGSLDDAYGAELVLPPRNLDWHKYTLPQLCGALRGIGAQAYWAPGGTYGVHITTHRRHLSPLQEARIALFLSASENCDFVRAVGQRQHVYSAVDAPGDIGALPKPAQTVESLNGLWPTTRTHRGALRTERKIQGMRKFSALHVKGDLLECRIFQSTLKTESLVKHLEFFAALVHWTRPTSATGSRWHHQDFYAWLQDYRTEYPALTAYLDRDSFMPRNGRGRITNTWRAAIAAAA